MATDLSQNFNEKFEAFFRKNPPTFAKSGDSKSMTVGGRRFHYDNFDSMMKLFDADTVLQYELIEWRRLQPDDRLAHVRGFIDSTYRKDAHQREQMRKELHHKINGGSSDFILPDPDFIVDTLRPARVLGEGGREAGFRFLDKQTKTLTSYDYYSVTESLKRCMDKAMIDDFMAHHAHIKEMYDPRLPYGAKLRDDSDPRAAVYDYNRYQPPLWKDLGVAPALDPDIDKLLRHLFPKDICREFVFNWIYHSLTARAGTYLYLCGGQGTGKNTLANLITRLHGETNSSHPKQDSFKGRFNYFLKDKTFVFFDEFNCRMRQDKDILKSIANKRVQIEGKNRDHEDIDLHTSYMLANNSIEAIGLDPIDRRFSVPAITDDGIVPAFGREWVATFTARILDDTEMIAAFGRYILEEFKSPRFQAEEPHQTTRFEDIVLATLRVGISETLARILKGERSMYTYAEEQDLFRKVGHGQKYPHIADWQKFFKDIRKDGEPICTVDGGILIPAPRFRKDVEDLD